MWGTFLQNELFGSNSTTNPPPPPTPTPHSCKVVRGKDLKSRPKLQKGEGRGIAGIWHKRQTKCPTHLGVCNNGLGDILQFPARAFLFSLACFSFPGSFDGIACEYGCSQFFPESSSLQSRFWSYVLQFHKQAQNRIGRAVRLCMGSRVLQKSASLFRVEIRHLPCTPWPVVRTGRYNSRHITLV